MWCIVLLFLFSARKHGFDQQKRSSYWKQTQNKTKNKQTNKQTNKKPHVVELMRQKPPKSDKSLTERRAALLLASIYISVVEKMPGISPYFVEK